MNERFKSLFEDINTVEEVQMFLRQLDNLSQVLYKTRPSIEQKIEDNLDYTLKDKMITLLEECGAIDSGIDEVEKVLDEIRADIKEYPTLRMEVAYTPTSSHVMHLAEWIQYNLKRKILIDVIVNPDLIGGAVIGYNGKMFRHTLKEMIDSKGLMGEKKQDTQEVQVKHEAQPINSKIQEPNKEVLKEVHVEAVPQAVIQESITDKASIQVLEPVKA